MTTGQLALDGPNSPLRHPARFKEFLDTLYGLDWVSYAKRSMGGPQQVINYLGGYTHRVAISNNRLLDVDDERVLFRTRRDGQCTLSRAEFTRRFLLHVLPNGFMKIRHYGLFASANVNTKHVVAQALLPAIQTKAPSEPAQPDAHPRCPHCDVPMIRIELSPQTQPRGPP